VLRERGVRVRILSGDHPEVVARVGAELGLPPEDAMGGLTPEAKRDIVARLSANPAEAGSHGPRAAETGPGVPARGRAGSVVMVGDGVNDAAALALADVGIAVHGGTGATIVAADVVFTREGVTPLLELMDGARRLRGVVRRNLAFSLLYNTGASAFAVAGLVGPLLAAVLMPLSSLTVVLSSVFTGTFARSAGREGPARNRLSEAGPSSPAHRAEA
jgi:Cu2+-exporting ATPase